MTTIPDVQLHTHNERLHGKVVLITGRTDMSPMPGPLAHFPLCYTGGAAGIGRETALQYARSKCVFAFGTDSCRVIDHTDIE